MAAGHHAVLDKVHDAVALDDLIKVKAMLNDHPELVSSKDTLGRTPLQMAAWCGYQDIVECLLADKARVDAEDFNWFTALHLAAMRGHQEVAGLLLSSNASVDAKDWSGDTPLACAAQSGRLNVA